MIITEEDIKKNKGDKQSGFIETGYHPDINFKSFDIGNKDYKGVNKNFINLVFEKNGKQMHEFCILTAVTNEDKDPGTIGISKLISFITKGLEKEIKPMSSIEEISEFISPFVGSKVKAVVAHQKELMVIPASEDGSYAEETGWFVKPKIYFFGEGSDWANKNKEKLIRDFDRVSKATADKILLNTGKLNSVAEIYKERNTVEPQFTETDKGDLPF